MLATGMFKTLRINKARIQGSIDAGDILANEGLEPALRVCAIERVARFCGKRMAMIFKLLEQILQSRQGRRTEFVPGVWTAEEDATIVPTSKRETAKAQPKFPRLRDGMESPAKGATRPPFSRISIAPSAVNSLRQACSSADRSRREV